MSMYVWDRKYQVGVPAIDEQHQALFEVLTKFHAKIKSGQLACIPVDQFKAIADRWRLHLRNEEATMQKENYPGYEKQKAEHDSFLRKLNQLESNINRQPVRLVALEDIFKWLVAHIQGADHAYGEYLKQ